MNDPATFGAPPPKPCIEERLLKYLLLPTHEFQRLIQAGGVLRRRETTTDTTAKNPGGLVATGSEVISSVNNQECRSHVEINDQMSIRKSKSLDQYTSDVRQLFADAFLHFSPVAKDAGDLADFFGIGASLKSNQERRAGL